MQLIRQLQVTTVAGTAQANPTRTPLPVQDGILERIEVRIPRGHAGLTGVRVNLTGTQLVPFDVGAFLVGDDDNLTFDVGVEVAAGALTVDTYNTGLLPHSHWIRAVVTPIGVAQVARLAPGPAFHLAPVTVSNVSGL